MNEIGSLLKETRETSGVSIKEASEDLDIKEQFLLNIEDGKIGCFADIFELKGYISNYAKYLGLDVDKIIDDFNEYIFEYTSRIPIKEIERQAKIKAKEESGKMASPYTIKPRKHTRNYYIGIYIVIALLVVLAIFWSFKQITIDNRKSNIISFVDR